MYTRFQLNILSHCADVTTLMEFYHGESMKNPRIIPSVYMNYVINKKYTINEEKKVSVKLACEYYFARV